MVRFFNKSGCFFFFFFVEKETVDYISKFFPVSEEKNMEETISDSEKDGFVTTDSESAQGYHSSNDSREGFSFFLTFVCLNCRRCVCFGVSCVGSKRFDARSKDLVVVGKAPSVGKRFASFSDEFGAGLRELFERCQVSFWKRRFHVGSF